MAASSPPRRRARPHEPRKPDRGIAQARGAEPEPRRVVVIGDTPRDVDCAKKNGCRSVAVATGWHTAEELRKTEADEVVEDLAGLCDLLERMWAT